MGKDLNHEKMHASGHVMIMYVIPAMITALLGIVGYIAMTTLEVDKGLGVLSAEQKNIVKAQIDIKSEIKETQLRQYTKEQAESDRRIIDLELKVINNRIDVIENDFKKIPSD